MPGGFVTRSLLATASFQGITQLKQLTVSLGDVILLSVELKYIMGDFSQNLWVE